MLAQLATLVMSMLGEEETFARYGGEEFAVVARGVDLDEAAALSERLRAAVEAHPFKFQGTAIPVTISVGVARAPAPGMSSLRRSGGARRRGDVRRQARRPQPRLRSPRRRRRDRRVLR